MSEEAMSRSITSEGASEVAGAIGINFETVGFDLGVVPAHVVDTLEIGGSPPSEVWGRLRLYASMNRGSLWSLAALDV